MAIWLTSDLHFGHSMQFIYGPRGFNSIDEHDAEIIKRWNEKVEPNDEVYILGDLMLNDNIHGLECLRLLNGVKCAVRGNHDTDARWPLYSEAGVQTLGWAHVIHYRKYHFYLSHFPTLTGSLEAESLHQMTLNLHGHTHSKDMFYEDRPYMFNVALDAHNCYPVLLDDIIEHMKNKVNECLQML